MAAGSPSFAALSGASAEALANLTWIGMLVNNLLPVTIGNIIGGGWCVAVGYYTALKDEK